MDVTSLPPFEVVVIPVNEPKHKSTSPVTQQNVVNTYLTDTRRWLPVGDVRVNVRPAINTDHDLSTADGWLDLLREINAIKLSESSTYAYYHGIVRVRNGLRYWGLAYVLHLPQATWRSAVSVDRSATIAHEFGHNLGRRHTPGCNAGNIDPDYPYVQNGRAIIGFAGYDVLNKSIVPTTGLFDYMSYCSPRYTSDYTFERILERRRNDPHASQAGQGPAGQGVVTSLMVWGEVEADGCVALLWSRVKPRRSRRALPP